jgi:hypothetical protein
MMRRHQVFSAGNSTIGMQRIPELALQHHASVIHNATIITAPDGPHIRAWYAVHRKTDRIAADLKKNSRRISSELFLFQPVEKRHPPLSCVLGSVVMIGA